MPGLDVGTEATISLANIGDDEFLDLIIGNQRGGTAADGIAGEVEAALTTREGRIVARRSRSDGREVGVAGESLGTLADDEILEVEIQTRTGLSHREARHDDATDRKTGSPGIGDTDGAGTRGRDRIAGNHRRGLGSTDSLNLDSVHADHDVAVRSSGEGVGPGGNTQLVGGLKDEDGDVRKASAKILAGTTDPECLKALCEIGLYDADVFVQFTFDEKGDATSASMKYIAPITDFSFDFHDLELVKTD